MTDQPPSPSRGCTALSNRDSAVTSDHGVSIALPSISGSVTKWESGRISLRIMGAKRRHADPGVQVEIEISPKDAKRLIDHLNADVTND